MTEKKNNSVGVRIFLKVADHFIKMLLTDEEIEDEEAKYKMNGDFEKLKRLDKNKLDPSKEIKANYKAYDIEKN